MTIDATDLKILDHLQRDASLTNQALAERVHTSPATCLRRVKALTEIADFNAAFGTTFSDEDYDTVGGLVIAHLGRLPKRGETVTFEGLRIQVLRADSRRVYTLTVVKPKV